MAEHKTFTFVIGGARSGKSAFALGLAEDKPGPRVYIATACALDPEMTARIEAHKAARGPQWSTIEEPIGVAERLSEISSGAVLIDCVTLWITNLLMAGLPDAEIMQAVDGLAAACNGAKASAIMVSSEVGMGIVPEGALTRRFRDLAGAANQRFARAASEVYFVAAGVPMKMK
ncbi:MAG: bifunctional adenosylcobinamide kinase/adenosylcobinamide-phosphate guanylyltransferase [Deltaproteobacteria bacterium]|nr:bifunctional adenosylcobinamide kinase/adenosylcobinamide-phosphate guanylyltransferase [Deltaproteobacteria bacterium]